jgi:hypothetical protein
MFLLQILNLTRRHPPRVSRVKRSTLRRDEPTGFEVHVRASNLYPQRQTELVVTPPTCSAKVLRDSVHDDLDVKHQPREHRQKERPRNDPCCWFYFVATWLVCTDPRVDTIITELLLHPETGSDSSIVVDDGNLAASRYSNRHGSGGGRRARPSFPTRRPHRTNLIVPFSFTATAVLHCRRRTGARIRFG